MWLSLIQKQGSIFERVITVLSVSEEAVYLVSRDRW